MEIVDERQRCKLVYLTDYFDALKLAQKISVFTKADLVKILEVDASTIDRYISEYSDELVKNGYQVLRGISLKNFRLADVSRTNEGDKGPSLGIFSFRALLVCSNVITARLPSERVKSTSFTHAWLTKQYK